MRHLVLAAALYLMGCHGDLSGRSCMTDAECGPGFDCYTSRCTRVCTGDPQCSAREQCVRYHCLPRPESGPQPIPTPPPEVTPHTRPVPGERAALPDTTALELRAVRRELQLLREEQSRLRNAVEAHLGATPPRQDQGAPPATHK